jgi:hypothetical protein
VTALVGGALVLAACGGDDDESADGTSAVTTDADATAAESEATQPDATEPDATEPDATQPESTEPTATEPPDATVDITEPPASEGPGGQAPSGDGDVYDVCGLVTPADLEGFFGSPFDPGSATHQEQTGGDQCVWTNTDAPPVKVVSVTVLRQDHLSGAFESAGIELPQLFADTKAYATDPQPLDLGEESYISGSQIEVLAGDAIYSISITGTSEEAIAGLRAFAELVITNAGA